MGTKITLPLLIFFFTTIGIAQNRKQIQGRISVPNARPSNVLILNLNTEQEVKSDGNGLFTILAQPEDVLIFSNDHLDYMRKLVEVSDFQQSKITVEMTSKLTVLKEVEIKTYNAVNLGILQKPAKSYTTMERRLKTAGDFKPIHLLGLLGGSIEVDPILNAINGKTKRLKKEIILEKNRKRLEEFQDFFPKEELISQIKIDPDQVTEFTYFILDEEEFKTILENREKSKMTFYLIQKHSQFKSKQNEND
ncbi:hypothetical protein FLAN108750_04380 [Flavobacterium antarcticum]|uniref:hypothetical protein n=1 Tax=Flavobacterium antarcticum TaxID=271155 RepID=UPI0003B796BD|nr:hypothetical protein [Flavobacterium antarcticum]